MNWETFKSMNGELQQEYLFRFKKKPRFHGGKMLMMLLVLTSITLGLMFISFMIMREDEFIQIRDQVQGIVESVLLLQKVALPIIIVYVINDVMRFVWYHVKEYWWRKKNGIKKVKGGFWLKDEFRRSIDI